MSPRFRGRKVLRLGPFYVNLTQSGFASWGIKIGRYTRNFTRGTSSLDTPGFGSVHWGGRRRSR